VSLCVFSCNRHSIRKYAKENEEANATIIYGRNLTERRSKFAEVSGGTALMDGDYGNAELRPMARGVLSTFYTIMLVLLQMSSNWLIKSTR
jgi:hypothetical protein